MFSDVDIAERAMPSFLALSLTEERSTYPISPIARIVAIGLTVEVFHVSCHIDEYRL